MAISKPCPRCQEPMEIPQPVPEKIQCAKCGVVIKFAKAPTLEAPKPIEAPKPAETPKSAAIESPRPAAVKPAPAEPVPTDEPRKPAVKRGGGVLSAIHTFVPKPILFGFYGALGGLLGVILLGE